MCTNAIQNSIGPEIFWGRVLKYIHFSHRLVRRMNDQSSSRGVQNIRFDEMKTTKHIPPQGVLQ